MHMKKALWQEENIVMIAVFSGDNRVENSMIAIHRAARTRSSCGLSGPIAAGRRPRQPVLDNCRDSIDGTRCRAPRQPCPLASLQEHAMPQPSPVTTAQPAWPELPYAEWKETYATLHLWSQIVGKIRLVQSPWLNHSWHVPLYVTARGLTTTAIPYGMRSFELEFDFIDHWLQIRSSDGSKAAVALRPCAVADFYRELLANLANLGFTIKINTTPNEMVDPTPFDQDYAHASYDAVYAHRFWQLLSQADRVFKQFRAAFIGKSSPVHFFWGAFDLAVTRFSGAEAPVHPGGVPNCPDWVMREAYSHEVASCGFWPGSESMPYPAFYAYAYPEPPAYSDALVLPAEARYDTTLHEFILPYEAVRTASSPDAVLLDFLQSSYEAAANLGNWDRTALERPCTPVPR
jgi:hypothetical protein